MLRKHFFQYLAQTSDSPLALEISHAENTLLYDSHGKSYIDLISGISVSNVGHSHPAVVEAITNQAKKYMHVMVYGENILQPQVLLAKKLTEISHPSLDNTYFVNSGSEAVEGALKLAKRYTGRPHIFSFNNAYHGSSHGSLSIMGSENMSQAFRPLLPGIFKFPFNSPEIFSKIDSNTAAVIIEPIQGEAGAIPAQKDFLKELRDVCTKNGTLLIFDEIQTGMGRTGNFFAFQHYQVLPDILLLAKALGAGMPLGAFMANKLIMNSLSENPVLGHITTFGGHPVSCAASLAGIDVLENEKMIESVKEKEILFRKYLIHNRIQSISGIGILLALELNDFNSVKKVINHGLEKGLITDWFLFNDKCLRIAPPLSITNEEIEKSCKIILEGLDSL